VVTGERVKGKMGHYETLGVSHDASIDKIKEAHRELALKYHPDRNLEDQEKATKMFKKIQYAFDVLTDPRKRSDYDLATPKNGKPPSGWTPKPSKPPPPPPAERTDINVNDVECEFVEMKGRGRDIVARVKLTPHERKHGCRKTVTVKRKRLCMRCIGDCKVFTACPSCSAHKHSVGHCKKCGGYGAVEETCNLCKGKGIENRYEVHTVSVKFSACNIGHSVSVMGEGEMGKSTQIPGNLKVIVINYE
jgi:molecular chaperone DnaJ